MHLLFSDAEPIGDHSAQFVVGPPTFGRGGYLYPHHLVYNSDDFRSAGVGRGSNGELDSSIDDPPPRGGIGIWHTLKLVRGEFQDRRLN